MATVNGPTLSLPEVALVPDQASEAVHEIASVDDQVRVEEPLRLTEEGSAVRDTVGAESGSASKPVVSSSSEHAANRMGANSKELNKIGRRLRPRSIHRLERQFVAICPLRIASRSLRSDGQARKLS